MHCLNSQGGAEKFLLRLPKISNSINKYQNSNSKKTFSSPIVGLSRLGSSIILKHKFYSIYGNGFIYFRLPKRFQASHHFPESNGLQESSSSSSITTSKIQFIPKIQNCYQNLSKRQIIIVLISMNKMYMISKMIKIKI